MKRTLALLALFVPSILSAQERGAIALGEAIAGLDVTPRVLMIGAHPDDEDTPLIAWLARGRQVETGYLSLTRGDGGQNLIGNELGVQLGMIRTEELLAARRVDGGRQFFTRAFDFGFSKTAEETYRHWPKDSILRDVVTVIRAFRPQVIVAVFSGTPADGHGHHQVSALLAREAFDAAADTVRFPRSMTLGLGPWSSSKYYRTLRGNSNQATTTFNVGELSPLRGRTYAELASISRSQHLSQGFGQLERRGASLGNLLLQASRVGEATGKETSPLDRITSDWSRFRDAPVNSVTRAALDSLPRAISDVRANMNLVNPDQVVAPLARVVGLFDRARESLGCGGSGIVYEIAVGCEGSIGDLAASLGTQQRRATAALLGAAGITVEATTPREQFAVGDTIPVTISVYNQGKSEIVLASATAFPSGGGQSRLAARNARIAPDSAAQQTVRFTGAIASVPWWLRSGRTPDVFVVAPRAYQMAMGEDHVEDVQARVQLRIADVPVWTDAGQVVYRFADPARGEQRRPVALVPAISVLFDNEVEYARADVPLDRTYNVRLRSFSATARSATVVFRAPGLNASVRRGELAFFDSATTRVALEPFAETVVTFKVPGKYAAGRHKVSASVTSNGETFTTGFVPLQYPHIRPLRHFRDAVVEVEAVKANLPKKTAIAYITGVGDNVAPMLGELGLKVTVLAPDDVPNTDLSKFSSIVVGPRAFAASRALVAQAKRLNAFAQAGGTVVMQYGQQEIQAAGILPYPVTLAGRAERVTVEETPVKILAPGAGVLNTPNKISDADFANWVQERSTYMPTTADPRWQRVFEMHDANEAPNENSLLIAPVGKGAYVYVTLALFRQLPAGVPGAARLFLNLVGADGKTPPSSLPRP